MARHVPGPYSFHPSDWTIREDANNWQFASVGDPGSYGCESERERDQLTLELLATGRLLAAAPDLLAALKGLVENSAFDLGAPKIGGRFPAEKKADALSAWDEFVVAARAAIAKAEGR